MGNFISFPNLIFAKFYLCKKALKTRFVSLFLLEKDLIVKILKTAGVFFGKSPFIVFLLPPVGALCADASRATSCLPRVWIRPPSRPPRPALPPPPTRSLSRSLKLAGTRNPSAAVICCRRRLEPRLAVLRPPLEPPCLTASPRARTAAEMA